MCNGTGQNQCIFFRKLLYKFIGLLSLMVITWIVFSVYFTILFLVLDVITVSIVILMACNCRKKTFSKVFPKYYHGFSFPCIIWHGYEPVNIVLLRKPDANIRYYQNSDQ